MPPEPLLKKLPQLQRSLLFFPAGVALGLLLFFFIGLTNALGFLPSLLLGAALGFAAAYLLFGAPRFTLPKPLEPLGRESVRPWYFFPLALLIGAVAYPMVGLAYTGTPLPAQYSAHAALAVAVAAGCGVAYWLVGAPSPRSTIEDAWARVPEDRRPWLFFPLALLIGGPAYLGLGIAVTRSPVPPEFSVFVALPLSILVGCAAAFKLVGVPTPEWRPRDAWARVPEDRRPWLFFPLGLTLSLLFTFLLGLALTAAPFLPVDYTALTALAVSVVAGFGAAFKLVGAPTPKRRPREMLPDVPAAARPALFGVTLLALGPIIAFAVGPLVGKAPQLPPDFILGVSLLAGYLLAFGVAVAAWGVPGRWKGVQVPGLPDDVKLALLVPTWLALSAALTFAAGLIVADAFLSGLVGVSLGLLGALKATGATKKLGKRRGDTLLPELPEKVKPLVLFPTWLATGALVFWVAGNLGAPFTWSLVTGASLGLAAALGVVEEPLIRQAVADRRERRARKREMEEKRERAMAEVKGGKKE